MEKGPPPRIEKQTPSLANTEASKTEDVCSKPNGAADDPSRRITVLRINLKRNSRK
jgi:hypothetical protein